MLLGVGAPLTALIGTTLTGTALATGRRSRRGTLVNIHDAG